MSFKIKNFEFERITSTEALSKLCAREGLPAKISYPLAMLMTSIGELVQGFTDAKEKILKRFEKEACSARDESGKPDRVSFDTNHEGFRVEWLDFMALEVELRGDPIVIHLEALEKVGLTISPMDQINMRPVIDCKLSENEKPKEKEIEPEE